MDLSRIIRLVIVSRFNNAALSKGLRQFSRFRAQTLRGRQESKLSVNCRLLTCLSAVSAIYLARVGMTGVILPKTRGNRRSSRICESGLWAPRATALIAR
jgi:hypothetical protein